MTLPSSPNSISLNQVQTEFGGSNPIGISEYYSAEGTLPTSGQISLSNFYGLTKPTTLSSGVNVNEILASSYISDGGTLTIPADVWVWSDDTAQPALKVDVNNATIINYGKIIGRGGNGGGQAGGPAITVTGTGNIIRNMSGAFIAGGGGGGGGRGGGGAGGGNGVSGYRESPPTSYAAGQGGAIGQNGTNGESGAYSGGSYNGAGLGGGAGGGGAGAEPRTDGYAGYGASGGGGRVLTVSTSYGQGAFGGVGDGGTGGSNGNAGSNGTYGGGGGGWGAAGGNSGGAGGAAISGSSGYTNSGTIYGSNSGTLQYIYSSGTAYISNGSTTSNLNSNLGTYTLHNTVWDYRQSGNIFTFTAGSSALGSLRFRATADPDNAPRSNSGNDRELILYKNGTVVNTASAVANNNAVLDTTQVVNNGDVFVLYMNNSMDWRDLGGFERIIGINIDGA